jgi:hypothetical protein
MNTNTVNTNFVVVEESSSTPLLKEAALRELISAGMVSNVLARGMTGGFVLEVIISGGTVLLASSKGDVRTFASIETMSVMLKRMGVTTFTVDTTNYEAGRVRAAQPERSKAMKEGRLPKKVTDTNEIESVNKGKK